MASMNEWNITHVAVVSSNNATKEKRDVSMKIGLKLPLFASTELGREFTYPELRDIALQVEAAGFDSIWLMDHLLFRWDEQTTQGCWEAWTLLSALAEATQRIELGSLVLCNQFRNPAILAKMAITLDEVSNGRFILGLGAGWHKPEYDAFGMPFDRQLAVSRKQ